MVLAKLRDNVIVFYIILSTEVTLKALTLTSDLDPFLISTLWSSSNAMSRPTES